MVRRTFGTRLLLTFSLVLTVVTTFVFTAAGLLVHHTARRALEDELSERLLAVARIAARELRPEIVQEARQGREPAVRYLEKTATRIREDTGVSEIVLFAIEDQGRPVVLVSQAVDAAARERLLTGLLADTAAIERAYEQGLPSTSSLYRRPPSILSKSAYAPITYQDRIVALVGVELPAEFEAAVAEVDRRFLGMGLVAEAIVLLTAFFLVRQRVHVPIYRLVRAMQGDEGVPRPARVRRLDEIGVLTERYNSMVDRLAEKDRELRRLYAQARQRAVFLQGYSNSLVGGVPSGVVAVDADGQLTVWNRSATRILGIEGPIGGRVDEVVGPAHPLVGALLGALAGSVIEQALVVLDRPDADGARDPDERGGERLVELTCAPFHGDEGQLLGAAALVTDRTELERLRRTASRNERLAAIGNLGAGLAHEIRNPLGAISGFAELIERKQGAEAARLARRLRGEVEELNRFLEEFLAFARDNTIRREPVDAGEVVRRGLEQALSSQGVPHERVAAVLAGAGHPQGPGELRVGLEVEPGLPPVALDAALVRSMSANLARNALQAMPRGGELQVRIYRSDGGLALRFRDEGPGIRAEDRERIFDPLFTTRAEGTGLGLAVCHKTAVAHGGKITVRDAPGGGAELLVWLPLVGLHAATPERDRPLGSGSLEAVSSPSGAAPDGVEGA